MIYNATDWDLRNLRGIVYCIINIVNGKRYIGQTINTFYNRYGPSWWNATGDSMNNYLRKSIKKYGKENFQVQILIYNKSFSEIDIWEAFYINFFKSNQRNFGIILKKEVILILN